MSTFKRSCGFCERPHYRAATFGPRVSPGVFAIGPQDAFLAGTASGHPCFLGLSGLVFCDAS